ncbi:DUF4352 domain-containing protein [Candidatus Saccharibacteria bacterium]|nr:DUF4352 domain-containing protein [Candidatus Saccharibacteria bacterium]
MSKKKHDESLLEVEMKEVKREWRHFVKFSDENHLLFAAFVVVLLAILVINTLYVLNRNNVHVVSGYVSSDSQNRQHTSQEVGTNGAMSVTISDVTENDKRDPAFTIPETETMLILTIDITNTTTETQQLIPSTQLYVRTVEGDYSKLHASMFVTKQLPAKDLKPGQTVSGQVSFSVPKRIAKPLLYVDTGWHNYGPVVFDVLH